MSAAWRPVIIYMGISFKDEIRIIAGITDLYYRTIDRALDYGWIKLINTRVFKRHAEGQRHPRLIFFMKKNTRVLLITMFCKNVIIER